VRPLGGAPSQGEAPLKKAEWEPVSPLGVPPVHPPPPTSSPRGGSPLMGMDTEGGEVEVQGGCTRGPPGGSCLRCSDDGSQLLGECLHTPLGYCPPLLSSDIGCAFGTWSEKITGQSCTCVKPLERATSQL